MAQANTPPVPAWVEDAVFYEIYPQTFNDTNGDGIGDLPGVIEKLDYIASLGVNALWLNPFYKSPMRDAGYDVADYYQVDPRYGTNDDAKKLFEEAKKRGLRVLIDFVPGHTSIDHKWFQESAKAETNDYSNWYIWTDSAWHNGGPDYAAKMVHGYSNRNGNYLINFFWSQPALNFGFGEPDPKEPWQLPTTHADVQRLWKEMQNVMTFWVEMGATGFRVDMAGSITRRDPDSKEARRFWAEAREKCEAINPDFFTVAEWSHPTNCLDGRGLHADFLHWIPSYENLFRKEHWRTPGFSYRPDGHSFFDRAGKGDISEFIKDYLEHYEATQGKGYISIPVSNHDLPRLGIRRDDDDLEIIYAFLLTMPGVPFIYYGDEIGMRHLHDLPAREGSYPPRPGARTPMQWSAAKNAGFSDGPADQLYYPVDQEAGAPNVEDQENAQGSLLNRMRELIAMRRKEKALQANADFTVLHAKPNAYPFAFLRELDGERLLVVLNPADKAYEISVPLAAGKQDLELVKGSKADISRTGETLSLKGPAVSYSIYRC